MPTDLDDFTALLDRWGVPYSKDADLIEIPKSTERRVLTLVKIPPGENPWGFDHTKVDGYAGFYGLFAFAPDGQFSHVGFWE